MRLLRPLLLPSLLVLALAGWPTRAGATLVDLGPCIGPVACVITTTPPNPVQQDPNDGVLLAWDEVQNLTLAQDLRVDRVFDPTAPFIEPVGNDFLIKAGTVVSSHYLQWDPGAGSSDTVETTIAADSQIFAFIVDDQNLFDSDAVLGLPGLDYNDFRYRGIEDSDTTVFSGERVAIRWTATTPGDWARLITAFSPGGDPIPEPGTLGLLLAGLAGLSARRARR